MPHNILAILSKIVEEMANPRIRNFIERQDLVSRQFSFGPQISTSDVLYHYQKKAYNFINKKQKLQLRYFVTLRRPLIASHILFSSKSSSVTDFTGDINQSFANDWLTSYLLGRIQYVGLGFGTDYIELESVTSYMVYRKGRLQV